MNLESSENELILIGKTSLGKRSYNIGDSNGTVQKASFGLPDNWYGGMVKEFRKIRGSGIMMCLDKRDNIINLAYVKCDLTDADKELLGWSCGEVSSLDNADDKKIEDNNIKKVGAKK